MKCDYCDAPRFKGRRCRNCWRSHKKEWHKRREHLQNRVPVDDVADMITTMLDEDGISVLELSKRVGLNEGTLRKILNGERRHVLVEPTLDRLCAYGDKLLYDFLDPR